MKEHHCGPGSRANWLISLNSGVPAASHHSNIAASTVVNVAPAESIRPRAVRQSISKRDPTASTATYTRQPSAKRSKTVLRHANVGFDAAN